MKNRYMILTAVLVAAFVAVAVVVPEAQATLLALPQLLSPDLLSPDSLWAGTACAAEGGLIAAKQLREKRAGIADQVKANLAEINKPETAEARKKELIEANEKALNEADELKRTIDQIERQADLDSELGNRGRDPAANPRLSSDPKERAEQARRAVEAYIRFGYADLSDEARLVLQPATMQKHVSEAMQHLRSMVREQRDLSTGTSGAVLPNEYWDSIEQSMLAFGGVRAVARAIRTANGNPFILPTLNDTANSAAIVAEAGSANTSTDPAMGSLTLGAFTYRTMMLISREMLQDASFDVAAWVNEGFGTRLARGLNASFTTGTGSGQPNGVVTASSAGVTMATGNSVVFNDLTQLEHSLDPAYRTGARFMWHDTTLRLIKQMVDSQSRPLWIPGIALREPDTVLGYPYSINQQMTALSSGGVKAMLFGRFDKYIVRDVVNPVLLRDEYNYAATNQVAFWLFSRHDGDLLDAGTDPMKHAVTPSP